MYEAPGQRPAGHRPRPGVAGVDRPADGVRGLGGPQGLRRRAPRAGQGRARGVPALARPVPGRARRGRRGGRAVGAVRRRDAGQRTSGRWTSRWASGRSPGCASSPAGPPRAARCRRSRPTARCSPTSSRGTRATSAGRESCLRAAASSALSCQRAGGGVRPDLLGGRRAGDHAGHGGPGGQPGDGDVEQAVARAPRRTRSAPRWCPSRRSSSQRW